MKVLLVSNQGSRFKGVGNPIMYRMRDAISKDSRVEYVKFLPVENSIYSFFEIRRKAAYFDIVHIHFGGLYALILRIMLTGVPVKKYITFHGTDIHAKAIKTAKSLKEKIKIKLNQRASFLSLLFFDRSGFVAENMKEYVPQRYRKQLSNSFIQGLGVDYDKFRIIDKQAAQKRLNLSAGFKYVLFSDVSNTPIKRRDIATAIVSKLGEKFRLLIMCGVESDLVPYYINASDCVLLTSDEEGSPNIIREALSLNKPIFSVDVGDANEQLAGLKNSCIISRDTDEAAKTIKRYIAKPYIDNTREFLRSRLDFAKVTESVVTIYENQLK